MTFASIVVEVVFCATLMHVGWVFLRGVGIDGFARFALAFVVGALVYVSSLVILVVIGLPSTPLVALAVALCVAHGTHAWTWRTRGAASRTVHYRGMRWRLDVVTVLVVGVLVAVTMPGIDAVTYIKHVDSFEYIAIAGMLNVQTLDEGVSLYQLQKRQLVVPALHAPAHYADAFYLRSVTPAFALSTVLFMVLIVVASRRGDADGVQTSRLVSVLVIALGVGLLVTQNRFVMHAFYINGHLLYGLLSAVVAGSAWLVARRSVDAVAGWSTVAGISMAVMQLTRVEGFVLTTALLVPILTSERIPLAFRVASLAGYGVGAVVWHGYLVTLGVTGLEVVGPLGVGVAALLLLTLLPRLTPAIVRYGRWIQSAYLVGLFAVLGALTVRDQGLGQRSWDAFVANSLSSEGYWGIGLLSLASVTVFAWILLRDSDRLHFSMPILAFLPQTFVIAYLRDAAYRVGGGDSLNRMLIQVVPLMVAFVVVSLLGASTTWREVRAPVREDVAREVVHE